MALLSKAYYINIEYQDFDFKKMNTILLIYKWYLLLREYSLIIITMPDYNYELVIITK